MAYSTFMNKIIEKCLMINQTSFPIQEFESITDFVSKITKEFGMPFSAYQTNEKNRNYVFKCTFNGRRSNKFNCPASLIFTKSVIDQKTYFTFNSIDSKIYHNYPEVIDYYNAHRNMLDNSKQDDLLNQYKLGVPPGIIRTNLNITTNSKIFYNIRRDLINQEKIENIDSLMDSLNSINNFKFILHKNNEGNFHALTAIHLKVSNSNYWNDIVNVDDTATNIYDILLTISQQGQYAKNISKNVAFGGKQKLTRTYKCSKCGSTKHNLQKCPYKYIDLSL